MSLNKAMFYIKQRYCNNYKLYKSSELTNREIGEITPVSVTQGQTEANDEDCCAAAHAVDRDLSTHAVTDTDNGAGWMKLEFDRIYPIHKVVIYYRFYTNWYDPAGWCVQGINRFKACVDNDNNVDVSVYKGDAKQKSCGTLQLTYGLEQSDQIYTLLCNTDGDVIKLSKTTGKIAVYEIVTTTSGTNYPILFKLFINVNYIQ